MSEELLINVLLTVLGILTGVGLAHISILRKLNSIALLVNTNQNRIETLYRDDEVIRQMLESSSESHNKSLELMANVVNQNVVLINKLTSQ